MIQNLIVEFLSEILGKDSEFILGEKEIKTLRLSQEARTILLDDLKRHKYKKNEIHRNYEKFQIQFEKVKEQLKQVRVNKNKTNYYVNSYNVVQEEGLFIDKRNGIKRKP